MKSGVSSLTLVSHCFQFAYFLSPIQCHLCGRASWILLPNSILFNKYTTFDFAFITWWTLVFFHLWWLYIVLLQIPVHNFLFDCNLLNPVCIYLTSGMWYLQLTIYRHTRSSSKIAVSLYIPINDVQRIPTAPHLCQHLEWAFY